MDKFIESIFYWTFYWLFAALGWVLRFMFDVIVYVLTLGFYKMKNRSKAKSDEPTFSIPQRLEHMHIVAGTGHGKTQLLQWLILEDIMELQDGNGSIVVIDSQGDLIKNIRTNGRMASIKDRIIIIDPYDVDNPPALNLFDFGLDRAASYDAAQREQLFNSAVSLYEYLFGALLGAELTAKQGMIFRYLARLMMVVENGTILTFMEFIAHPETTAPYYDRLDEMTHMFFETQFSNRIFDETRQQILYRVWAVMAEPTLSKMFTAQKNSINFFEAMNKGSLILIYTAKGILKQEGCQLLGRFCLALIAQAAQERALIPEEKRRATFVYIDEAHEYFDESIEQMLIGVRKYKVGLIIAHQSLSQLEARLREIIMGNTSIKLVGGMSGQDTAAFAREFNSPVEWFAEAKKTEKETMFVCFIKNQPPPTILHVPLLRMEGEPKLAHEDYDEIVANNRKRYTRPLGKVAVGKPTAPVGKGLTEPEVI